MLQELDQHCNYDDKLKEVLRDRPVCGITDDRIQRRLLAEPKLTSKKALKVTQVIETANRDVRDLQLRLKMLDSNVSKAAPQLPVHNVQAKHKWQSKASPATCYKCGGGHMARDCRFINEKCHACEENVQILASYRPAAA